MELEKLWAEFGRTCASIEGFTAKKKALIRQIAEEEAKQQLIKEPEDADTD